MNGLELVDLSQCEHLLAKAKHALQVQNVLLKLPGEHLKTLVLDMQQCKDIDLSFLEKFKHLEHLDLVLNFPGSLVHFYKLGHSPNSPKLKTLKLQLNSF